jgi:pimeloyl-ACP methyl ester carboxylesterase
VGFINWCQNSNIDLFVFGWVWRLSSEATANFFLNRFLPAFDSLATSAGCSPHPLDNFWLVGHSFGGMVVKQISVDQSVRPKNKTRDYRRLAILRLWRTGAQIFQG